MEQIDIEREMKTAVNKIEEIGGLYAEAKALSYQMQKMRSVVLASEMRNFEGSMASREMNALASDKYILHLAGVKEAIEVETKLKAGYERWQAQYEACRSLLSLEKAKANIR